MKKRFLQNLSFFLVLNLIVKTIYVFGIDRTVQNTLGIEVYGSYFPLLNLVLIFQIFLDLGIENYTRKEIASSPQHTNQLFSNFIVLKLLLIIAFVFIFSVIGYFLPQGKNEFRLLLMLLANQSMVNFILYLRANMGGLQLFKSEGIISVFDRFLMVIICGTLLFVPRTQAIFKLEWFVLSQTVAYAITLIISLIIVLRRTGKVIINFKLSTYIPILKELAPFTLLSLLMAIYYRTDSIFLRYLVPDGKEQAGIYAHGFRILDFMSNYALIFSFILLPTFAKMIREKLPIGPLLRLAASVLIIPSVCLLAGLYFYRLEIFGLLYHEEIAVSANVFGILSISFIGICVSYTFGALLTANGNLKALNLMALFAVVISLFLNIVLIPKYKVMGAAIANATAQLFTIIFHVLIVKQKFSFKIRFIDLLKLFLLLILCFALGKTLKQTDLAWYFGILIITGVSLVFGVLVKLVDFKDIKLLLSTDDAN